jgi:hypothetical protein
MISSGSPTMRTSAKAAPSIFSLSVISCLQGLSFSSANSADRCDPCIGDRAAGGIEGLDRRRRNCGSSAR